MTVNRSFNDGDFGAVHAAALLGARDDRAGGDGAGLPGAPARGGRGFGVIKMLRPSVSDDEVIAARFLREAQVNALMDHPNIARVLDAGRHDERLYLVSEHVYGPRSSGDSRPAPGTGRPLASEGDGAVGGARGAGRAPVQPYPSRSGGAAPGDRSPGRHAG